MKKHTMLLLAIFLILSSCLLVACEAEVGERCDGFFQNTCKAPATCIYTDDGAYCADTCDSGTCPDGFECVPVIVESTSGDVTAGEYCLPVLP